VTRPLARWLAAAAVAWPLVATAAVWERSDGHPAGWTTLVYAAASRICHQRPDRSFRTAGVQWPVCSRCSGLYLGAAAAALMMMAGARSPRRDRLLTMVVVASVPTAVTWVTEWLGHVPVADLVRTAAALPLGAAIAVAILGVANERPSRAIG